MDSQKNSGKKFQEMFIPIHSASRLLENSNDKIISHFKNDFGSKATRNTFFQSRNNTPGPGQYHNLTTKFCNQYVASKTKKVPFQNSENRFQEIKLSPGPGFYNFNHQSNSYSHKMLVFQSATRRELFPESKSLNPGPGAYHNLLMKQKVPAHKFIFQQKLIPNKKSNNKLPSLQQHSQKLQKSSNKEEMRHKKKSHKKLQRFILLETTQKLLALR